MISPTARLIADAANSDGYLANFYMCELETKIITALQNGQGVSLTLISIKRWPWGES